MFRRSPVPFGTRYRTSRQIFGQAWQLVRAERDLWRFPIASGAAFIVMIAAFSGVYPLLRFGLGLEPDVSPTLLPLLAIPVFMALSIPVTFLVTLFNAAYCFGLYERMDGRDCTPGQAWARARSHSGTLFRFTLLASLVGGVLALVGQLLDKLRIVPYVGQALQAVGTFAWAVAAFFVIPIVVVERETSAFGALRTSVGLARDTWGRSTAGMVTIGLALMVPMFIVMAVLFAVAFPAMMLGVLFGGSSGFVLGMLVFLGAMGLMFLAMGVMMMLSMASNAAYQVALFRTTRTGNVPLPFTPETLVDAWTPYQK